MRVILICLLSCFASASHAQRPDKKLDFCYWRYDDTASARKAFGKQTAFFQLKNNDTIVDIGSSSGGLDGALASFMDVTGVHFILVDIDSNCLNPTKVKNMQTYYAQVKGAPLAATFSIVNNTTDSLYLPLNRYRKVFLLNTLHEIPNKEKMVQSIRNILQPGGELILGELLSRPRHTVHGGCRQALLTEQEIKALFEQNGFLQKDTLMNPVEVRKIVNPLMMARFVKQ